MTSNAKLTLDRVVRVVVIFGLILSVLGSWTYTFNIRPVLSELQIGIDDFQFHPAAN